MLTWIMTTSDQQRIFILGISGAVGGLLARRLAKNGDEVTGLVRTEEQASTLTHLGAKSVVGELTSMSETDLADAFRGQDVIVFSAGSNGGAREITTAVDGEAVARAAQAARSAGVRRFILVSVLPESWRERDLDDEVEYYFEVKKRAEVQLTRTDLDWVILRPALLTDNEGRGLVSLGPAELHEEISRDDVAEVLLGLVHEHRIRRQILELNTGTTTIADAIQENTP